MTTKKTNILNLKKIDSENCSICRDLLAHMGQFFDMLETARRSPTSDWLTVEDVAKELKISKSIVYRIIRNGELEAVNIVETGDNIAKKGHYRIKKPALNRYIESKRVVPFSQKATKRPHSRQFPKVKNRVGL